MTHLACIHCGTETQTIFYGEFCYVNTCGICQAKLQGVVDTKTHHGEPEICYDCMLVLCFTCAKKVKNSNYSITLV